ncbi:MAG: TraX family protein [Leptolyngbya sp.]|nr:MAG: TraX family protein [Leptolyngbya sp.]
MLIDHIGVVFFPDAIGWRIVGRLSFPLFIWLLVQGEAHTRDIWRYVLRLVALGAVTQPIYQLTFGTARPNILFVLLLGLVCLRLARNFPRFEIPIWLGAVGLSVGLDLGYGSYGIGLLILTRYFRRGWLWAMLWVGFHWLWAWVDGPYQLPAIAVLLIFWFANGDRGPKARWFYASYPAHLALLWLIRSVG